MSDPSLEIQRAIVAALKVATAVAGGRIYDRIPDNPTFPYVQVGDGETVGDDNPCFDASEVNVQAHVWSRAVGYPEAKAIAAVVRTRLTQEFTITGFKVTEAEHVVTRYLRDPDGLTSHAVVEMRYLVDHDL